MRFVEPGHRADARHRQGVTRQRAGFVGAQHIHRCRFIHRGETSRQHPQSCQGPRAKRARKGEGGRQRDRYRGQHRGQNEGNDLRERHLENMGVGHQQHDEDAVEQREVAHHAQHRGLLRTHDMGGKNEFRGAAEPGARSGSRDFRHRLAASHQRSGIGLNAGTRFDGYRLAREHRLVEEDFSRGKARIGSDDGTQRQLHHIAGHQFDRWYGCPFAVPVDGCVEREPRLQRGEGRLSATFLKQPQRGVEQQERGDDRGLDELAEHDFQHDRGLEHPRNRRPEFFDRPAQRMRARIGHRVWPEFLQSAASLIARQPILGRNVYFFPLVLIENGVPAAVE
jgi:hypothetical protein